jgi:hypothetical protein
MALNAVTYLDMAVRGRPASSTPEESVKKLAAATGVTIPGDAEHRGNRISALGPLLGLGTGIAVGGVLGVARAAGWAPGRIVGAVVAGGAALVAANAPMVMLKVTDVRTWSVSDWVSDLVPHLAYGAVAFLTLEAAYGGRGEPSTALIAARDRHRVR